MSDVPHETHKRLRAFAAIVVAESAHQNLVSAATLPTLWERHIADSLQLLPLAPAAGRWIDIGSGAGFPGMVVAIAGDHQVTMVEPRALRADFLRHAAQRLGLDPAPAVIQSKVERISDLPFAVISARAVASIERIFAAAHHLATPDTIWLLPKGRTVRDELAAARATWQGDFRLVPSQTDADAAILVATGVQRRTRR